SVYSATSHRRLVLVLADAYEGARPLDGSARGRPRACALARAVPRPLAADRGAPRARAKDLGERRLLVRDARRGSARDLPSAAQRRGLAQQLGAADRAL